MQFFRIISLVVSFICILAASADSAGYYRRRNGLAYGGIPYGSISGRLADFIRGQARYPIRSFSTEDYSDDDDNESESKTKSKNSEYSELEGDPRLTVAKFLKGKKHN